MTFDEWFDKNADRVGWYGKETYTNAMRQAWEAGREEGRREMKLIVEDICGNMKNNISGDGATLDASYNDGIADALNELEERMEKQYQHILALRMGAKSL